MLSKLNHMRESREQGFTLIELLVVILIIGILAAIAIPMFLNQRKAAVDSSVQSDVSNAAKQVETWITTTGATEKGVEGTVGTTASGDSFQIDNSAGAHTFTPAATSLGDSLASIKVSDGTVLTVTGTSFDYEIVGKNSGGSDEGANSAAGIVYESQAGGLQ